MLASRQQPGPFDAAGMPVDFKGSGALPELGGLVIVVTRPRLQGATTAHLLRKHGAEVVQFPVLDIFALPADTVVSRFAPERISSADAIIFVSANAAQFGMALIHDWVGLAARTRIFAIGQATRQALITAGVDEVICPADGNDSEALLALPQMHNVTGQQIVLVRGISDGGGRTLLADTLIARRAQLWPLECYQRQAVTAMPAEKFELSSRLRARTVHGILVLSVETLDSLVANMASMPQNRSVALLVSHPRIAAAATAYGFERVEVIPMGDDNLPVALHRLKKTLLTIQAE